MEVRLLTGETIAWEAFLRSTDGNHRVAQARTQARYDGEDQQDIREGHQDIGEPHDDRLGPGA